MNAITKIIHRITGRGDAAITMPPMDGALRPNQALEEAELVRAAERPDNLIASGSNVMFSSGRDLVSLKDGKVIRTFDRPISALAPGSAGSIAVGLSGAGVVIIHGDNAPEPVTSGEAKNVTAVAFDGEDLIVCEGSARHAPDQWKRDLMELGFDGQGSGSVWRISKGGQARKLAGKLRYPNGAIMDRQGRIVVSEAWNHRLIAIPEDGRSKPATLVGDLTGYPARMAQGECGVWLSLFAPRSQLIEFVLREPKYRARMMAGMEDDYWIAPSLANGRSFLEPLQGGAVKQMGVLKPWAPSRSYGLVVLLDQDYEPVLSLHSRADGIRHGTTSVIETGGQLLVASKGGNAIVKLNTAELVET
jgi:hypothetical protein